MASAGILASKFPLGNRRITTVLEGSLNGGHSFFVPFKQPHLFPFANGVLLQAGKVIRFRQHGMDLSSPFKPKSCHVNDMDSDLGMIFRCCAVYCQGARHNAIRPPDQPDPRSVTMSICRIAKQFLLPGVIALASAPALLAQPVG